jgi:hypothetical protein
VTGTDLAVIATIVAGYVTGIFATLHYLAGRIDRVAERIDKLADDVREMKVTLGRMDERIKHLEPQA